MCRILWSVIIAVLSEVFLMIDAAYVGYIIGGGINTAVLDTWVFWVFLVVGVSLRYWAEHMKEKKR